MRPARGDELDKFLETVDGGAWTSVENKAMQANVQLTDEELDLIQRLAQGENPDASYDRASSALVIARVLTVVQPTSPPSRRTPATTRS